MCLQASTLDQAVPAFIEAYGQRFREILPLPSDYPENKKEVLEAFSKAVTSNLLGGVGYFYGTSIIDPKFSYEWDEDENTDDGDGPKGAKLTEPKALLTATPSRASFPRGFYWWVQKLSRGPTSNVLLGTRGSTYCTSRIGTMISGSCILSFVSVSIHLFHLSLEILKDWVNLIDEEGWVAREQILGEEARSKVVLPERMHWQHF